MTQKKIMVPIGPNMKDLNQVHHALALAERIQARVFFLRLDLPAGPKDRRMIWVEEALLDLINSARQAGLDVSYQVVRGDDLEEVVAIILKENINLVIIGTQDGDLERHLLKIRSVLPSQIIRVQEKENITYL